MLVSSRRTGSPPAAAWREEGVLEIFRSEIGEAMVLSGCATIADIDRSLIS